MIIIDSSSGGSSSSSSSSSSIRYNAKVGYCKYLPIFTAELEEKFQ